MSRQHHQTTTASEWSQTTNDVNGAKVTAIMDAAIVNWVQGSETAGDDLHGTVLPEFFDGCGGSDRIHAGAGNDYVVGGEERDFLWGEAGDDVFCFSNDSRSNDVIRGFIHGQDLIELQADWMGFSSWSAVTITEKAGDWVEVSVACSPINHPDADAITFRVEVVGVGSLDQSDFWVSGL